MQNQIMFDIDRILVACTNLSLINLELTEI